MQWGHGCQRWPGEADAVAFCCKGRGPVADEFLHAPDPEDSSGTVHGHGIWFFPNATVFVAVNDNGWAAADETTSLIQQPPLAALPPVLPQFGTLSTIQELIGFFEYYGLANPICASLINGNILVR